MRMGKGEEDGKRGMKRMTKATGRDKPVPTIIIPCVPPMYPCVPTVSLQAAVMDLDPRSEGLYGQDPPRPPCVPVSPLPRDKVVSGVPRRGSVPVSCPVPPSGPPGGIPQLEVLLRQVHSLQKVREATTQELVKAQDCSEGLRQHLEQLEQHKEALERSWQQVQESLQRAQLQGKEVDAKGQRRCGLCLEKQQDLEGTKQQWEELQNLRRGHRWQHCQQLEAIMEELKQLRVTHAPAHLEAELVQLEKMEEKWLSWERRVMDAEEQLGPEAPVLRRLVQQEQEGAGQQLEVELGRQQLSLQRCDRLAEELQQLQRPQEALPE
ncbi:bromodomain-containing protein DDB_G0280777-like isoform X2 [Pyrgilauda ruficollis]|uniref:bromodomain-containing protein DDB_G0280777-like isoform X2 n=1 Tax=Pyrgilauda ruficollis TaxID=221976 RepID=UPI001B872C92|nr:bromodomain-containing protein DDB_G0280777-like isoform X2 [Pyrgilauda ruficollis]